MIDALARVEHDLPPELFEFWDADEPYQSGANARRSPPDPNEALAALMAKNKNHVTGAFSGRRWNGTQDGKVPTAHLISWYYDRVREQDSLKSVDRSNTFQVNIPLTFVNCLNRPQITQKLVTNLCEILQPLFALGGLCMATPLDAAILHAQQQGEPFCRFLRTTLVCCLAQPLTCQAILAGG